MSKMDGPFCAGKCSSYQTQNNEIIIQLQRHLLNSSRADTENYGHGRETGENRNNSDMLDVVRWTENLLIRHGQEVQSRTSVCQICLANLQSYWDI